MIFGKNKKNKNHENNLLSSSPPSSEIMTGVWYTLGVIHILFGLNYLLPWLAGYDPHIELPIFFTDITVVFICAAIINHKKRSLLKSILLAAGIIFLAGLIITIIGIGLLFAACGGCK